MALTDSENFSNAPRANPVPSGTAVPQDYLARLPVLHAEAARNARLGGFVTRSVQAAGLLMVAGAATLFAGGGTLQSDFAWSVLVLAGVAAIIFNYLRGQSSHGAGLEGSAADLRAILLYTGFAWGAGAFLALPADPGALLAFAFAAGPVLVLFLLLKDEVGLAAFAAPVAGLTAVAGLVKHWSGAQLLSPVILAACIAVIVFAYLRGPRTNMAPGRRGTA